MKTSKSPLSWIAFLFVIVGTGNFFWFMGESLIQGGDALNGYVKDGQYYVGEHGTYTRVSPQVWQWSHTHGIITFVTFMLAFASMFFLISRHVTPAYIGLRSDEAAQARVQAMRASGPLLVKTRCNGRASGLRLYGIAIAVYPAGVILAPIFMVAVAIPGANIKRVVTQKGWLNQENIEITHSAPDISSPVILTVSPQSPVIQAIAKMTAR